MNLSYIFVGETFCSNFCLAKITSNSLAFKLNSLKEDFFKNLKSFSSFFMIDHSVVDYPSNLKKRFLLYYSMISYVFSCKVFFFFKAATNVFSLSKIYPCAEWLERESFDFFGIFYANHPDLRRILTDYGFPSYALRKDFPVQGYFDIVYSIANKKIQFKEIEFQQSFRVFLKENPYHLHLQKT